MSENGYPKWAKDNTSTVADDPANEINRAKNEPGKEAPGITFGDGSDTIHDGHTDVVVSHLNKPKISPIGKMGAVKQHYPPCINPTCKSFGKSHPNCLCYAGPGGSSLEQGHFADGGQVCSGSHLESCEHYAEGGQVEDQKRFINNPGNAIDHLGVQNGLLHVLTKLGHNGRSENPHKHFEDFTESSRSGVKTINHHMKSLIGKDKLNLEPDKGSREGLKSHLNDLNANPEKITNIGGSLGQVLPMHAAVLGSRSANALNYFNGIKPKPSQGSPLDPIMPPSKSSEAQYDRQIDIAQQPHLVLQHVKDGTVQPADLQTLKTVYPELYQSVIAKSGEALIDAKNEGRFIPYRQKQGLSSLLGQPMDSIQSPAAMQAIMQANATAQTAQTQGKPKKASGVELKQIDKVNSMSATPDQARLLDKKQ